MKYLKLIILLLVLSLAGCTFGVDFDDDYEYEKYLELPANLLVCSEKYFEEGIDCNDFANETVCVYFSVIQNSNMINQNLEFRNACFACSYFGLESQRQIASRVYSFLGYAKGDCQ